MKVISIKEHENHVFKRKEIEAVMESDQTLSKNDVLTFISEKYKIPVENIVINQIHGKFGTNKFNVMAQAYNSKDAMNQIRLTTKKQRDDYNKAKIEGRKSSAVEKKKSEEQKSEGENK